MGNFSALLLEHNSTISTITLNRPEKHNAFNNTLINELTQAFEECQQAQTRCIILKANGRHFCAGADLNWMKESKNYSVEKNKQDALQLARLFQLIANNTKPIICVIQGRAMGGACGLAAACDFTVACHDASFCFSEVKLGLIPATIAPYIVRRVGYQAARRYFLTAELIKADRAEEIHLIDFVSGSYEDAIEEANQLADQLISNGPRALASTKKLLAKLCPVDDSVIEYTSTLLANIRVSDEAQEGLTAFFDKRKPNWC